MSQPEQKYNHNYAEENQLSIIVKKTILLKALSHIQSIVEKRNIIPVLSNVKLEVSDDSLLLTATDMDITVTECITAEIISSGSITVSAHTFYDIVKKLPEENSVEIFVDNIVAGKLNIHSASCKFSLPFLPALEFPIMDHGEMNHKFNIKPEELIYLIDKTKFAISIEETRYNLNGIYFHISKDDNAMYLITSATDGHRLSKAKIQLIESIDEIPGIIVPRKTIIEIRKLLDIAKENINIALSTSKISFNFDNIELVSKLIDGNFPEYESLIPYDNEKIVEIETKIFAKAIDRVSTINFDKLRAVKLSIENNKIMISANGESQGSAFEEIDISYDYEAITIGFNSKYLLDIMNIISGNNVLLKLKDNYSPAILVDKDDSNSIYVIMPMVI